MIHFLICDRTAEAKSKKLELFKVSVHAWAERM